MDSLVTDAVRQRALTRGQVYDMKK
jgi:hypothetical protein